MEHLHNTPVERMLFDRASRTGTPIYCTMELLPLCNMNCDMCFIRLTPEEMQRHGRLRTADEWLDMARQMREAGVLFVSLTGGEPLLFPEFRRLYTRLLKMGMILTINTNGTLVDEEWAAFFGAHRPRRINITLYGSDERAYREVCHYPGGYAKTLRAVRLLREQGVDVKINGTIVRDNADSIEQITSTARELDAAVSIETYMFPATRERERPYNAQTRQSPEDAAASRVQIFKLKRTREEFRRFAAGWLFSAQAKPGEEIPGEMRCTAGKCALTINWQGEMRPCVMLSTLSVPAFELGFDAAWAKIRDMAACIRCSAACSACTLRNVCDACAASALHETGKTDGVPEYLCRYTRATQACLASELQKMRDEDERNKTEE